MTAKIRRFIVRLIIEPPFGGQDCSLVLCDYIAIILYHFLESLDRNLIIGFPFLSLYRTYRYGQTVKDESCSIDGPLQTIPYFTVAYIRRDYKEPLK